MSELQVPQNSEVIQKNEEFNNSNTEAFQQDFKLGPLFPSDIAIQQILDLLRLGSEATITFHLENGKSFDLTIGKPYILRRYEGNCIVKVYK